MRITFVINSLSTGGAERNLVSIANFCAEAGDQVEIITFVGVEKVPVLEPNSRIRLRVLGLGTKHIPKPYKIFAAFRLLFALRAALRVNRADVIVAFMDQANILTLLANWGTDTPCLISERVNSERSSLFEKRQNILLRWIFRRIRGVVYRTAAQIVFQTERACKQFKGRLMAAKVIPNPIELPEVVASQSNREKVIIVAGRLTAQKRVDLVLQAFAKLSDVANDWRVEIYGEGKLREDLQRQTRELGLEERVLFCGITHNLSSHYQRGSIFILASDYEGFPSALGEALAHGLACISTDCDYGPRELINSEDAGILIKCGDSKGLAEALERLISDGTLRQRIAEGGRLSAGRFQAKAILTQWRDTIISLGLT